MAGPRARGSRKLPWRSAWLIDRGRPPKPGHRLGPDVLLADPRPGRKDSGGMRHLDCRHFRPLQSRERSPGLRGCGAPRGELAARAPRWCVPSRSLAAGDMNTLTHADRPTWISCSRSRTWPGDVTSRIKRFTRTQWLPSETWGAGNALNGMAVIACSTARTGGAPAGRSDFDASTGGPWFLSLGALCACDSRGTARPSRRARLPA